METNHIDPIKAAVNVMRQGGIIAFRSDTGWTLACDATKEEIIKKLVELQPRNDKKTILVDEEVRLDRFLPNVPEQAYQLIDLSEKPLTLLFSDVKNLPEIVRRESGFIAFRVTKDKLTHTLAAQLRQPLFVIEIKYEDARANASLTIETFTSSFSVKDETTMEIKKGGIIRFIS